MEILNLIFNANNAQTLILLVAIIGGVAWLKADIKFLRYDLEKEMSGFKNEITGEMSGFKNEISGIKEEMSGFKNEISGIKEEMSGFKNEIKNEISNFKNEMYNRMSDFENKIIALIDEKLDKRFSEFHRQLKENDFAHLEKTIKALTFMLEKNKFLTVEDKGFIDSQLEN